MFYIKTGHLLNEVLLLSESSFSSLLLDFGNLLQHIQKVIRYLHV